MGSIENPAALGPLAAWAGVGAGLLGGLASIIGLAFALAPKA